MGPWIDYLARRRGRLDEGVNLADLTKEEKLARDDREEMRKIAIDVFKKGGDTIDGRLYVVQQPGKEPRVEGQTTFGEGILRFVGTMMARMSKQLF
jgi:hypothetical protein